MFTCRYLTVFDLDTWAIVIFACLSCILKWITKFQNDNYPLLEVHVEWSFSDKDNVFVLLAYATKLSNGNILVQYFISLVKYRSNTIDRAFEVISRWYGEAQCSPVHFVCSCALLHFVTGQFWPYSQELLNLRWGNNATASVLMNQSEE